jgi:hypothetical protein
MDHKIDNTIGFKNRLVSYYKSHRLKINSLLLIFLIIFISIYFFILDAKKKNILISEKYVQAGLYLADKKEKNAKDLYVEIILSENKFYSILALNTIIENKLVDEDEKIIKYFKIVENLKLSNDQKDLLTFKKALYLIKIMKKKEGEVLLKKIVDKNSKLKILAKEILDK